MTRSRRLLSEGSRRTGGVAGLLTQIARQTGISGYPGDGTQRWPAVHAVDDEGDAVRDIATVIGRLLADLELIDP